MLSLSGIVRPCTRRTIPGSLAIITKGAATLHAISIDDVVLSALKLQVKKMQDKSCGTENVANENAR